MAGSSSFKSGLMLMFWTFKLGFDVDILAFYNFSTVLATFFRKLGDFFPTIWSHWFPGLADDTEEKCQELRGAVEKLQSLLQEASERYGKLEQKYDQVANLMKLFPYVIYECPC